MIAPHKLKMEVFYDNWKSYLCQTSLPFEYEKGFLNE